MEKIRNNYSELSGNLGRNPELRYTKTGKEVINFSIAVNDYKKEGNDFKVIATHWIPIVMWEPIPDNVKVLSKGDRVSVVGKISNRSWTDKDDKKFYVTEILAKEIHVKEKSKFNSLNPSCIMEKNNTELKESSFTEEELPF